MESSDFSVGDTVSGEVTEIWHYKSQKPENKEFRGNEIF